MTDLFSDVFSDGFNGRFNDGFNDGFELSHRHVVMRADERVRFTSCESSLRISGEDIRIKYQEGDDDMHNL